MNNSTAELTLSPLDYLLITTKNKIILQSVGERNIVLTFSCMSAMMSGCQLLEPWFAMGWLKRIDPRIWSLALDIPPQFDLIQFKQALMETLESAGFEFFNEKIETWESIEAKNKPQPNKEDFTESDRDALAREMFELFSSEANSLFNSGRKPSFRVFPRDMFERD